MDYYFGTQGGTERQVIELIRGLDQRRYKPVFAVFQDTRSDKYKEIPCKRTIFDIKSMSDPKSFLKMIELAACIHRLKIDLVHIFFNDASIIAPPFCKIGGAKVITSRRDMGFWYTPAKLIFLRISNLFVDRIAANSMAVKENVCRWERFPKNRIEVLYNGLSADRFNSAASPDFRQSLRICPQEKIIGMVSNLYPVKRPRDLIQALSYIHEADPRVHVVFIGGGPAEIDPLQVFVRDLGLHGKVHFLGRRHDVGPIIKQFDVCVLCSESEGLPNAILEYMACAKPVVCTNAGGNTELVQDGVNGYLTKPGNIEQLAHLILKLLGDDSLRTRLGESGRKICLDNFGLGKMISEYMCLYDRVLNNKNYFNGDGYHD